MPKHEIFHRAGHPVSEEIKGIVEKYFDAKEIEKLERLGGRILISVAAPYKPKIRKNINIDEEFVSKLKSEKKNFDKLKGILDELSIKQLKKICELMNQPVRSNANSEEIKRELIRSIQAEDYWNSITRNGN
jgi:hypothetical protein